MASKHYHLKLNIERQADIIARIEAEPNKNGFIADCVRAQIYAEEFAKNIFQLKDEEGEDHDNQ